MDNFWSTISVFVAIIGTIASIWVAFIVGFPRRRLYYGMEVAAPLLEAPAGMRSDLELRHRGTLLSNPYVMTVKLVSKGRRDIPSDAFDQGQPLVLDLGADIIHLLQFTSWPDTARMPQITVDRMALKIGPSLIGKRQTITMTVLVDGGQPCLTCESPLADVNVLRPAEGFARAPHSWRFEALSTYAFIDACIAWAAVKSGVPTIQIAAFCLVVAVIIVIRVIRDDRRVKRNLHRQRDRDLRNGLRPPVLQAPVGDHRR